MPSKPIEINIISRLERRSGLDYAELSYVIASPRDLAAGAGGGVNLAQGEFMAEENSLVHQSCFLKRSPSLDRLDLDAIFSYFCV